MDRNYNFNFNISLELGVKTMSSLLALLGDSMSQLSDAIAAASASADAAIARVGEDVQSLRDQVAALKAQVDAGLSSPADLEALSVLTAKLNALDPTSPEVLPG